MLRIATEADVPAMLSIYAPYILTTTYSFEYDVPTGEAFLQRFRRITARFPWLVWEEDGRILGYAYGSPPFERAAYAWCAESSVYLCPEARGRDIGRRLCAALEELLRLQGYQVLYALITEENTPSRRFHEKNGFLLRAEFPRCGYKFNRWLGLIWMEKRLNSVEFPSKTPVPWVSISTDAQKISNILYNLSLS